MRPEVRGVTIDDQWTRDIDDAIWVDKAEDGWTVWVSIADVSKVVTVGSDEEVRARTMVATKYFARSTDHMLPVELAEEQLSLWPHKPKRAITAEIKLPLDLSEPVATLYRSRLISQAKLSYSQIPASLAPDFQPAEEHTGKLAAMVKRASELSMGLLERRRKNGALALYDLNSGWITTEEGFLRQIEDHREAMGQIVVQEMMILANMCVAQWAVNKDIPVPFRNHTARLAAPERQELLQQLSDAMHTPVADITVFRQRVHTLLDKAEYGASVQGHYGLNLPWYLHFTSPIRRYADLVTHRQIRAALKDEPLPYSRDQIDEVCRHINETIRTEAATLREQAKDKAEGRARRVVSVRHLASLNAKDFERVCKVWGRSPEETPEELVEAVQRRLAESAMPLVCTLVAFSEAPTTSVWNRIRGMLVAHFASHPHDAVSLLTAGTQTSAPPGTCPAPTPWSSPVMTTEQSGPPPHALVFRTTARWSWPEGDVEVTHQGTTKKRVEQELAVLLLAKRFGVEAPEFEAVPTQAAAPPPKKSFAFDATKDPISVLMEYCQAHRMGAPEFVFDQRGPSHVPTITCTARCAGKESTATSSSKQDAKRNAAIALIAQLRKA